VQFEMVVKGGEIYTGQDCFQGDIGIKDGRIAAIAPELPEGEKRTIDAGGMEVLPAAVDPHVHFNLELPLLGIRSQDSYWTGGIAAARGGLTTVLDFSEQRQGEELIAGVERKIEQARGETPIDYGIHPTVYDWNPGLLSEIEELVEAGFPTLKMFMIYSEEGWRAPEAALLEAMRRASEVGATILVHCENDTLLGYFTEQVANSGDDVGAYGLALSRPNVVEASAVRRAVDLCEHVDGRLYVVHLSTAEGARCLERAQQRGVDVTVETCPQFLLLTEDKLRGEEGHLYAASPQLKKEIDNEALWQALENDVIDVIGTDNCTFTRQQKDLWEGDFRKIPRGLPGCETLFPLIYTYAYRHRGWSLNDVVRKTSLLPSRAHGLYPDKGSLQPGTDADIIVVDPEKSMTVRPQSLLIDSDWSPYEGFELYGFPEYTICRGKVVIDGGEINEVVRGHGQLVRRSPLG